VPPPEEFTDQELYADAVSPALRRWVRTMLVVIALLLIAVFTVAVRLDPYQRGKVWFEETHTQLGLPACTFKVWTGLPCPSCGMTSSFALLMHGDVWHSLQANAVGTLLALFLLAFIPWSLVCAFRGRLLFLHSLERDLTCVVGVFLTLLLIRWGLVLVFFR
jgi:hypothetical protein